VKGPPVWLELRRWSDVFGWTAATLQSSLLKQKLSAAVGSGAEMQALEAIQAERPTGRDHKSRRFEWSTTSFNG